MIEFLSEYIKNISIFLIFTTFAGLIITDEKYKKYINLTLGFVMIFIILSPIRQLLANSGTDDIGLMIEDFATQLNIGDILQNEQIIYDNSQNELILSTYRDSIKEQLNSLVDNDINFAYQDATIEIDDSEERFGDILAIYLEVAKKTNEPNKIEPTKKPFVRIEPVEINTNSIISSKYNPNHKQEDETNEMKILKTLLSDFYNLSYDNIYITVHE